MQLRPGQSEHLDLVVGYQGGNFFMNYHLELKLEMSVLGLVSVPRDCWSPPKPTLFIQKIQMTDKFLNPNLCELPAGWFTLCLQGFADGGSAIPCDLLVPIHSGVEVRYGRNLAIMACDEQSPEVDMVLQYCNIDQQHRNFEYHHLVIHSVELVHPAGHGKTLASISATGRDICWH